VKKVVGDNITFRARCHIKIVVYVGSPFEMIVEAKDIPEADTYIDMAVAEVSRKLNFRLDTNNTDI
jgi:thiamine biosynthesis lipoprotein